jgi:hypothetical protein
MKFVKEIGLKPGIQAGLFFANGYSVGYSLRTYNKTPSLPQCCFATHIPPLYVSFIEGGIVPHFQLKFEMRAWDKGHKINQRQILDL